MNIHEILLDHIKVNSYEIKSTDSESQNIVILRWGNGTRLKVPFEYKTTVEEVEKSINEAYKKQLEFDLRYHCSMVKATENKLKEL